MVAKIQLEPVAPAMRGKPVDRHAAGAQRVDIMPRQRMAADTIEQHADLHAGGRALQQYLLQAPAQRVVVDDEELHQQAVLGRGHGCQHHVERGFAVDQQAQFMAAAKWPPLQRADRGETGAA
jgi:hypothetical protein